MLTEQQEKKIILRVGLEPTNVALTAIRWNRNVSLEIPINHSIFILHPQKKILFIISPLS